MMRSIQFIFTLLVLAAIVPILPKLPWFRDINDINVLSLFAGSIVALALAFRELNNERERRENRTKTKENEARIETIELEKIEQNRLSAIAALAPEVLADESDAGYHWQILQPSIDTDDYYHFLNRFKGSPYDEECLERTSQLSRWQSKVNQFDPIDISYFLMSRPYYALARHAREKLSESIKKAAGKHESEFWKAVVRPLWVFFPLVYLIGIAYIAVPVLIFEQTRLPLFEPVVSSVTDFLLYAVSQIPTLISEELTKPFDWIHMNINMVSRVLITAILCLAAFYFVLYIVLGIWFVFNKWQEEQRDILIHSIGVALANQHKGLL